MSLGAFFLGLVLVGVGVLIIWRRHDLRNYVGDLGSFFDFPGSDILDWGVLGAITAIIGIMLSLGIFQAIATTLVQSFFVPKV